MSDVPDRLNTALRGSLPRRAPARRGRDGDGLCLAAKGLTMQQIADRPLHFAQDGRPPHPAYLRQDLGLSTRAAAALWAMRNGVVH